jgi:uracil-DNA glycosylase family 4
MQEDLVILLEWFIANGITELFNDNLVAIDENIVREVRNTGNYIKDLARQQNEIRELGIISNTKPREVADKINNLDELLKNIINTDLYSNFKKTANNTIVIDGNREAKILIINDLPNENDDIDGKIFSGEVGILFNKMMKAIDLSPDDYCLLNTFFWRLPGNRSPIKEELNNCKPSVEKIISILEPSIIILTGNYSVSTLFEENKTLINVRGKFFDYTNCYLQNTIKITGMYGPAFLMKNQAKKKEAWDDLLKIKEFISSIDGVGF